MANHASAIKRARQNEKRRLRNRMEKTKIRTAIKKVHTAIEENQPELESLLDQAKSVIDKGAKKGIIHWRNASRKVSRLSTRVHNKKTSSTATALA
ncbi:MAG: 30S ribosomal protein S20 [Desulfobacterales bacterium]|nr:30S ribosomal protein S20 [Desulfobacterales bacterium]